jgi:hypothetical protein
MVKRLVNGHSVRTVARWLADIKPAGECFGLSFWTFRKYIDAFVPSLRAQVASVRQAASQRSRKTRAVLKGFDEVQLPDPVPLEPPNHRVSRVVTKAVREMEAHAALKYAFVTQMERVEEMRAQEKLHPDLIITGDGHKSLAVLNDIAAEILKWELGNKIMRSTAAITAPPRAQDIPPDSLDSRVAKLDPVDRNLVGTATALVSEIIYEQVATAKANKRER